MNSELYQSMQERKGGMETAGQQNTGEYTPEAVKGRILYLQKLSRDPYYNQYLGRMLHDLERHIASPDQVAAELDRSYAVYQKRMYYNLVAVPGEQSQSQPPRPLQSQPYNQPPRPLQNQPYNQPPRPLQSQFYSQPPRPSQSQSFQLQKTEQPNEMIGQNTAVEFFVGAGMLSIIGALFLVVAFIIFSLNFLDGPVQSIILYAISAGVVLLSELLVRRKLPRFAAAISGMGIIALYVATIISYQYLGLINSLAALIITLGVAVLSLLLGSKKSSSAFGLVGIVGSYICCLMIGSIDTDGWFLVAMVTLFLINFAGLFLPGYRGKVAANLFHLGLNTLFTVIFAVGAAINGVETVYIIFGITLNIALLNCYIYKQNKSAVQVILYGIELGILGFMTLLFATSTTSEPDSIRLYIRFITVVLTLAVGVFFYLINRDKKIRVAFFYYSMLLSLFLIITDPAGLMHLYLILFLFLAGRIFLRSKEWEVLNCFLTTAAFITGLAYADLTQSWLYFGAFLLSALFIRRWHLFYRCTITLFLILFAVLALPTNNVSVPICAAILFGLNLIFHFVTAMKDKKAMKADKNGNPANEIYTGSNVWIGRIYLIINFCILGIVSLYTIYCRNFLPVIITALIGAAAIIGFLSPRFNSYIKRKYLIMTVYLTLMSLIIRVGTPVYVSVFLAAVAIFCIAAGFKTRDKALRIYGLVLALCVCVKVAAFDFRELDSLQRIILFLIIGVVMLTISMIYIILEIMSSRKNLSGDVGQRVAPAPLYQVAREVPTVTEETAADVADTSLYELLTNHENGDDDENESNQSNESKEEYDKTEENEK